MYHHHSFFVSSLLCLLLQQVGGVSAQASKETLVIGGKTVSVNPTNIVINSTTIAPGSSAVTIHSEAVSVDSAYDVFVSGSIVVTGPEHPASTSSHLSPSSSGTARLSNSLSNSASGSAGSTRPGGSSGTAPVHTGSASQSLPSSSGSERSSRTLVGTGPSGSSNPSSSKSPPPSNSLSKTSGASGSAASTRPAGSSGTAPLSNSVSNSVGSTGLGSSSRHSGSSTGSAPVPSNSGASSSAHGTGVSSSVHPPSGTGASSSVRSLSGSDTSKSAHGTGPSSSVHHPSGTGASSSVHLPSGTGASSSARSLSGSDTSKSAHGTGPSSSVRPPSGTGASSSLHPSNSGASSSAPFPSGSGSSSVPFPSSPGASGPNSHSSQTSSRPSGTAPLSNSQSGSSSNASPGSSVTPTSASATSGSSGGNGATTTSEPYVGTGLILPTTKIATTGAAESSQAVILGVLAGSYASHGKAWGHSIAIPAIKTQALNENHDFSINAVAAFTNLGGTLPPKVNACGGGGLKTKFRRSLWSGIKNLVGDALGLAECAVNIASDLGGMIDVPPGTTPDFDAIAGDFDALEELSEEEEDDDDDNSSSSEGQSSTASSQTSSSASSSSSGSSSSSASSSGSSPSRSSSSASSSSASFALPPVQTDGLPDDFAANLNAAQIASINSQVSASLAALEASLSSGASSTPMSLSGTAPRSSSLSGTGPGSSGSTSKVSSEATSRSSGAASSPTITSRPSSTGSPTSITSSASYTGPKPDCMLDGASWMSPTSYCDCGPTAVYPTISIPATITGDEDKSSAMCAYTSLDPSKVITPVTVTSPPTNIPGQGGVPGCAAVVWGPAHLDCLMLPASITAIVPTANCPVNTAYSKSLASASSASAVIDASSMSVVSASAASVSSASAATVFDPTHTTTSCGATFGNGGDATSTPAPRAGVDETTQGIAHFCTPPDGTLTIKAGDPAWQNFALPNTDIIYQVAVEWDPNPACANHPAPSIVPSVPTGPDYWCNTFLLDLLNGCDTGNGQDKSGGRLYTGCAIYEWNPFIPGSDFNEPVYPWHGDSKRDLGESSQMERRGDERKNTRISKGRISRNLNAYG